jgi:hypothetical protein
MTTRERFAEIGIKPFIAYCDPREHHPANWYVTDAEDSVICKIPHDILMIGDESSLEGIDNPAKYYAEKIAALLTEDFFAACDRAEKAQEHQEELPL